MDENETLEYKITQEILGEVRRQRLQWGDVSDSYNSYGDWVTYITAYATKHFTTKGVVSFRTCMVKVAALAISAIKSEDR